MRTRLLVVGLTVLLVCATWAQSTTIIVPPGGGGTSGAASVTGAGTVSCSPTTGAVVCTGSGGLPTGLTFSTPTFTVATGAANQLVAAGATATNPVTISATGSDASIPILITPKNFLPVYFGTETVPNALAATLGLSGLVIANGTGGGDLYMNMIGANGNWGIFNFSAQNGTLSVPTATTNGQVLGQLYGTGYNTASAFYRSATIISFEQDGAESGTTTPGRIVFSTIAGAAPTETLRLDSGGHVTIADLATTGAATGKTIVCSDTAGRLYRSSSGVACAN